MLKKKQNMLNSSLATAEKALMNSNTEMNKLTRTQPERKRTGKYENNLFIEDEMRKANICQIKATQGKNKASQGLIIGKKLPEMLYTINL